MKIFWSGLRWFIGIAFLGLSLLVLAWGLAFWGLYSFVASALLQYGPGALTKGQVEIAAILLAALVVIPFVKLVVFKALFGGLSFAQHAVATVGLVAIFFALSEINQQQLFDFRTGKALAYACEDAEGKITYSWRGGFEPRSGRECVPVTNVFVERQARRRAGPPRVIDVSNPEAFPFFDGVENRSIVFYAERSGRVTFFDRAGYDPVTSKKLLAVTPEIVERVIGEAKAKEKAREAENAARATSGSGTRHAVEHRGQNAAPECPPGTVAVSSGACCPVESTRPAPASPTPERVQADLKMLPPAPTQPAALTQAVYREPARPLQTSAPAPVARHSNPCPPGSVHLVTGECSLPAAPPVPQVVHVRQCIWQPVVSQYPAVLVPSGQPVIVTETQYILVC